MRPLETLAELELIIRALIENGLSDEQRHPILKNGADPSLREIAISGSPDLSISMQKVPYSQIYDQLYAAGAFHARLLDGALVQMCYRFRNNDLLAHRLCLFPSPTLAFYDECPEVYDADELYADIVGKNIVHVPLRFDFDANVHTEFDHPKSHLTLGEYPNCRIPVTSPLGPARFMKFILRNFYFRAFQLRKLASFREAKSFPASITSGERSLVHISC